MPRFPSRLFDVDDDKMCDYSTEEVEEKSIVGHVKRFFKTVVRTIKEFANLYDVSVVANPAYPNTFVDARNSNLVGAEVRSRVAAFKPMTFAEMRRQPSHQSPAWPSHCKALGVSNFVSFEDLKELGDMRNTRSRRLAILDL
jgi:hypothetical protein